MTDSEPELPLQTVPKFLTPRNYEKISGCRLQLLILGLICEAAIDIYYREYSENQERDSYLLVSTALQPPGLETSSRGMSAKHACVEHEGKRIPSRGDENLMF